MLLIFAIQEGTLLKEQKVFMTLVFWMDVCQLDPLKLELQL